MFDPIVDEVRRVRAAMWDSCGGDMERYIAMLQAAEQQHPERLVTLDDVVRRKGESVSPTP